MMRTTRYRLVLPMLIVLLMWPASEGEADTVTLLQHAAQRYGGAELVITLDRLR